MFVEWWPEEFHHNYHNKFCTILHHENVRERASIGHLCAISSKTRDEWNVNTIE